MTKILITGANSFIGSNFHKYSCFREIDEVSLINNSPDSIDFRDYDVVLHLAAIVHQNKSISTKQYLKINRDLCLAIAKKAKSDGVRQFVFLSTLKVFGNSNPTNNIRNENSECNPIDPYGKSKFEAELLLKELNEDNFCVTIIRPSLVYGEGVKANMLKLIKLVDRCRILPLGNIEYRRNFIFSGNLIALIDRAIELRASGIFIAIDEKSISTTELVGFISRALGKDTYLFRMPKFIVKIARFFFPVFISRLFDSLEFENSLTMQKLNLQFPFSTEEGIKRTVESAIQR